MEASGRPRRVEIGFQAGQTLSLRLREDAYARLISGLRADNGERWLEIESEDSRVEIDLSQVVYVRLEIERGHIGF